MDNATELVCIQYIHHMNTLLVNLRSEGGSAPGEDEEKEGGGGGTALQHQHRWKSFVSQQEDWSTFSFSRAAVMARTQAHRMQLMT